MSVFSVQIGGYTTVTDVGDASMFSATGFEFLFLGGTSPESCVPCYPGSFCASVGLSSPTGPCTEGFYCPANFSSISPTAFLCPKVRLSDIRAVKEVGQLWAGVFLCGKASYRPD